MIQVAAKTTVPKKTFNLRCPHCEQLIKRVTSHPDSSLTCPRCKKEFSPTPARPIITRPTAPPLAVTTPATQPPVIARQPTRNGAGEKSSSAKKPFKIALVLTSLAVLVISGVALLSMNNFLPNQEVASTSPTSNLTADGSNSERENNVVLADIVDNSKLPKFVETNLELPETSIKSTSIATNEPFQLSLSIDHHAQLERKLAVAATVATAIPNFDSTGNLTPEPVNNPLNPDIRLPKPEPTLKPKIEIKAQPIKAALITTIQPFGGITWNDTPLTVIQKLQNIDNLETLRLSFTNSSRRYCEINRNYNELKLRQLLRSNLALHTHQIPGINGYVMPSAPTITASPIAIGDGVFTLNVQFDSEPGSILKNPAQALAQADQVFGKSADFYYPIRLTHVSLNLFGSKTTSTIDTQHLSAIYQTLVDQLTEKYSSIPGKNTSGFELYWRDKAEHQITLTQTNERSGGFYPPRRPSVCLLYSNQSIDFAQQLRIHQEKLQENQAKLVNQQKFANATNLQGKL